MSNAKTNTTSLATERSIKALNDAQKASVELTKQNEILVNEHIRLVTAIEDAKQNLDELDGKFKVDLDEAKYKLSIKVRDQKAQTLAELLKEFNLAEITTKELGQLRLDLDHANRDVTTEIEKAKDEITSKLKAENDKAVNDLQNQNRVAEAELKANAVALQKEIDILKDQLEQATKRENDNRAAQIEIATAQSKSQPIVLNTGK